MQLYDSTDTDLAPPLFESLFLYAPVAFFGYLRRFPCLAPLLFESFLFLYSPLFFHAPLPLQCVLHEP